MHKLLPLETCLKQAAECNVLRAGILLNSTGLRPCKNKHSICLQHRTAQQTLDVIPNLILPTLVYCQDTLPCARTVSSDIRALYAAWRAYSDVNSTLPAQLPLDLTYRAQTVICTTVRRRPSRTVIPMTPPQDSGGSLEIGAPPATGQVFGD